MQSQSITAQGLLRFILVYAAFSNLSAVIFLALGDFPVVRGMAGGIGCLTAFIGAGVALYYSFRVRNYPFTVTTLWSVVTLAFWVWKLSGLPGNPGFRG